MRLRLERLAHAPVSNSAIEDAFVVVVPQALRPLPSQARLVGTPTPPPVALDEQLRSPVPMPLPPPLDVASVPDLLSELEQEIFKADPWGGHPAGLTAAPMREEPEPVTSSPDDEPDTAAAPEPAIEPPVVETPLPLNLRQVAVESGPRVEAAPAAAAVPLDAPASSAPDTTVTVAEPPERAAGDEAPVLAAPGSPGRSDTAVRLAVGLGAAGCVLLAALLYESGLFPSRPTASASPRASASATVSHRATPQPTVAPSAVPSPTPPPPAVLATLGQGVTGESVFRIRPGTANPTWTRLVFDLTGRGLPTMVIAQPDALHLQVTFRDTSGAGVPVSGIHSRQVLRVEPAVQQGPDLVITIDLTAPMRLVDFTLPPEQGYAPRLVLDIHST